MLDADGDTARGQLILSLVLDALPDDQRLVHVRSIDAAESAARVAARIVAASDSPESAAGAGLTTAELGRSMADALRLAADGRTTILAVDDLRPLNADVLNLLAEAARACDGSVRLLAVSTNGDVPPALAGVQRLRLEPLTSREQMLLARRHGVRADPAVVQIVGHLSDGNADSMLRLFEHVNGAQLQGTRSLAKIERFFAESPEGPPPCESSSDSALSSADSATGIAPCDVVRLLSCSRYLPIALISDLQPGGWPAVQELISKRVVSTTGDVASLVSQRLRAATYWGMNADARQQMLQRLVAATSDGPELLHLWFLLCGSEEAADSISVSHRLIASLPGALAAVVDGPAAEVQLVQVLEVMEHVADLVHTDESLVDDWLKALRLLGTRGFGALARRYLRMAPTTLADPQTSVARAHLDLKLELLEDGRIDLSNVYATVHLYGELAPAATLSMLAELAARSLLLCHVRDARQLLQLSDQLPQTDTVAARILQRARSLIAQLTLQDATAPGEQPATSAPQTNRVERQKPTQPPADHARPRLSRRRTLSVLELLLQAQGHRLAERWQQARDTCALALETADGLRLHVESTLYLLVEIEVAAGCLSAMRSTFQRLERHATSRLRSLQHTWAAAWAALSLGDSARARRLLNETIEPAPEPGSSVQLARIQALLGKLLLAHDPRRALRLLQSARASTAEIALPSVMRLHGDVIEAALQCGRTAAAQDALSELVIAEAHSPQRWTSLTIDHAVADLETLGIDVSGICLVAPTVAEQWQIALAPRHKAAGQLEYATTAVGYARWLFMIGDVNTGRQAIEYAVTAFEQAGLVTGEKSVERDILASTRLIREAEPETEGFLIRQRETSSVGLSRLDDEQRRVVEYVRAGLRTKDIAQRLFLSVRSVELRLTAVYRTLGVRSRRELLTLLGELPSGHDGSPV
ncbi:MULTISPECIES: helix-turn-helix transcriptional regulator [unclassified Pseudoclavibacter]|uniref:helix-turn-helix transcriptional regulator n=1 Tax=unclassified Pseudoclavibacter TaxID=2615177 RepID=UPI0013012A34|nr:MULTISPECIES: LuxR family transcriptional regulator [unclassified Pseudoclavibacter]KAB1646268.1 hypothetical protein F8O06_05810 [Pseudoclavibacter sp. CFCC 14310]KAB1663570.1 hypothetical protein F8O08_07495 [Pseudoclavibacter sp. CFCC 13611]